jgi:hypothetical protein
LKHLSDRRTALVESRLLARSGSCLIADLVDEHGTFGVRGPNAID